LHVEEVRTVHVTLWKRSGESGGLPYNAANGTSILCVWAGK
jgi:hypothetical protein